MPVAIPNLLVRKAAIQNKWNSCENEYIKYYKINETPDPTNACMGLTLLPLSYKICQVTLTRKIEVTVQNEA